MTTPAPIPGAENLDYPETNANSLQRVTGYPLVKDSLDTAYNLISANTVSLKLYNTLESAANKVLDVVAPHLPVAQVDAYANKSLDYIEKKYPVIKTETGEDLVKRVRKPADDAVGIAKTYTDGIQSRLSPVTDQVAARIAQGQETLHALQERLTTAVAALPHDKASASEAINSIVAELHSLTTYLTTNAKELPANAQAAAKPLLDGFSEGVAQIKIELGKDVPVSQKAANILDYSSKQVAPILTSIKELITKKKAEAEATVDDASAKVNDASAKVNDASAKVNEEVTKVNGTS